MIASFEDIKTSLEALAKRVRGALEQFPQKAPRFSSFCAVEFG